MSLRSKDKEFIRVAICILSTGILIDDEKLILAGLDRHLEYWLYIAELERGVVK